jgi:hypothetical protein
MSGSGTVLTDAGRLSRLSGAMGCPGVQSNRSSLAAQRLGTLMPLGRLTPDALVDSQAGGVGLNPRGGD